MVPSQICLRSTTTGTPTRCYWDQVRGLNHSGSLLLARAPSNLPPPPLPPSCQEPHPEGKLLTWWLIIFSQCLQESDRKLCGFHCKSAYSILILHKMMNESYAPLAQWTLNNTRNLEGRQFPTWADDTFLRSLHHEKFWLLISEEGLEKVRDIKWHGTELTRRWACNWAGILGQRGCYASPFSKFQVLQARISQLLFFNVIPRKVFHGQIIMG